MASKHILVGGGVASHNVTQIACASCNCCCCLCRCCCCCCLLAFFCVFLCRLHLLLLLL